MINSNTRSRGRKARSQTYGYMTGKVQEVLKDQKRKL